MMARGLRLVRRHRRRQLLTIALAILLLVPAGVLAVRSLAVALWSDEPEAQKPKKPVATGPTFNIKDPFDATPAADYPQAEEGIVVPAGSALGPWSPEQVTDVVNRTKQLLMTARVDERVLVQGDTAAYVDQLAVSTRQFAQDQLAGERALGYVSRIASEYRLSESVRVKGAMNIALGERQQLVVTADYVWVYALDGPKPKGIKPVPGQRLVVLHSIERYEWYPQQNYAPADQGLRPGDGSQYTYNVDCEKARQGMLALPRTVTKGKETAPVDKAYDPATPPEELPSTC